MTGIVIAFYLIWSLVFSNTTNKRARQFNVVLFCGLVCWNLYVYMGLVRGGYGDDWVSGTETLLQELQKELPPEGRVGFVSDGDIDRSNSSMRRYFLAQYALAPLVIEKGTEEDFVIVSVEKFRPELMPAEFSLVRDFGQGLMLFRKRIH